MQDAVLAEDITSGKLMDISDIRYVHELSPLFQHARVPCVNPFCPQAPSPFVFFVVCSNTQTTTAAFARSQTKCILTVRLVRVLYLG
jgi:hypothetical protein